MKKDNNYYLGIDTSAYTTSLSVIDDELKVICDIRKILNVKKGERGLRQQEAIFQHINNISKMIESLSFKLDFNKIVSVGISSKPRKLKGSYMPVFSVGQAIGSVVSSCLKSNYFQFSHQEGHIASGLLGTELEDKDHFIAIHISGGTTEVINVNNQNNEFITEIIGGSLDISFGQFIDRLGVLLGLQFPCGKEMNEIALDGSLIDKKIPIKNFGKWFNISGLETFFIKVISEEEACKNDIAKSIFHTIGIILKNCILDVIKEYKVYDILIVGGVASNSIVKDYLRDELSDYCNLYFPEPKYCTDNSIGLAYLAKLKS